MTEAEWLSQREVPGFLLKHVKVSHRATRTKHGRRQLRLVSCGCCRLIWPHLDDSRKQAVGISERFADGSATEEELRAAREAVAPRGSRGYSPDSIDVQVDTTRAIAWATTIEKPFEATRYAVNWPLPLAGHAGSPEVATALICDMVRDIFGNPFRPITFSPEWRTDAAAALARQMYESHDFSLMPILADALQDAGCDNADILDHCRGSGPHVRGCWVVDLVLGKS